MVKHRIAVRYFHLTAIHYKPVERNVERNGYTVLITAPGDRLIPGSCEQPGHQPTIGVGGIYDSNLVYARICFIVKLIS